MACDVEIRRYTPAAGEAVVGVIVNRLGESFNVDINGPCPATLPLLAFEGATVRELHNLIDVRNTFYRFT